MSCKRHAVVQDVDQREFWNWNKIAHCSLINTDAIFTIKDFTFWKNYWKNNVSVLLYSVAYSEKGKIYLPVHWSYIIFIVQIRDHAEMINEL